MMTLNREIIKFSTALILCSGILLCSCKVSYIPITIENSTPAKEELPEDIQSLTLMNRSMSKEFDNYREDSLQNYYYRKGYQLSKIVLDSTASDTTIMALSALLFESGRYDVVVPVRRNIPRNLSYNLLPDPLSPETVAKICKDYDTDALMVLEKFVTKPMADYSSERYLDASTGFYYSYYASLDLKYEASFRIYQPGKNELVKEFNLVDTINWESTDNTQERMLSKLPTIKQAMINAGIKVALDIDEKISPTWTSEKRGYFLIQKKDDPGEKYMKENNYEEAGKYWTEKAQSKDKKIRSKAEYNLALISELDGDLDGAIEWGLKSFYSDYRYQTETYLKKLQNRKITLQKNGIK
jgi:hypothetical protein